jgi:hypothetical protein
MILLKPSMVEMKPDALLKTVSRGLSNARNSICRTTMQLFGWITLRPM